MRKLSQMEGGTLHFPKLYDVKLESSASGFTSVFIIMEYVEHNLRSFLEEGHGGKLQQKDIIKIVYQLLCGLRFLTAAKVLHRDIKPENILIDKEFNVKICDFGLARYYRKESRDRTTHSKADIASKLRQAQPARQNKARELSPHVVSRWYRAPEVILLERYDSMVDCWSLGCVIVELVLHSSLYSHYPNELDSKILFQGDSCDPLSPTLRRQQS